MSKVSVLFVCMGNICRSPTAHGIFEHFVNNSPLSKQILVDSAGTQSHHNGEKPDKRSSELAQEKGYDLRYIRSRKVVSEDFENFDYIIAMDSDNLSDLRYKCPEEHLGKLHLFLELGDVAESRGHVDVPDPYYGGMNGFKYVLDLVEEGSQNILGFIQAKHF